MDALFLEYRDPIFGIVIFFSIIFIIAFLNYWWGVFKNKEERYNIERFIKRFEVIANDTEYKKLLDEFSISSESLGLLAHSYSKSGEYEKAIGIYLIALKRVKSKEEKQYFLFELGKTYFKAGFLRRSSDVFTELLRFYPRHKEALKLLTVIYEQLKEYSRSLEVLDVLEELEVKVDSEKNFVKALRTLNDNSKTSRQKYDILCELLKEESIVGRLLFEFSKKEGLRADLDEIDANSILDLLWESGNEILRESKNPLVLAVLAAKGEGEIGDKAPFEFEILANLKKIGYAKASLSFEYTCLSCKGTFPVHFYRCPACYTLKSPHISPSIIKSEYEKYYSF